MVKLLNKNKDFVTSKKKNPFPLYAMLLKIVFSLLMAVSVPILFFAFFLFREPRNMEVINRYIDARIRNIGFGENYEYKDTRISLEGVNLIYSVKDLKVKVGDNFLFFPEVRLRIRVLNLLRGRFVVEELNIGKLESHINLSGPSFLKIHEKTFPSEYLSKLIYKIITYIHTNDGIVKSLKFDSGVLYFSSGENEAVNKFELIDNVIHLGKKKNDVELNINFKVRVNGESRTVSISGNCSILQDRSISCRSNADNVSFASLHFTNVPGNGKEFGTIAKNIVGLFDCEFSVNFSNYITLENSNFIIYSSSGSFNLEKFFGGKIVYQDVSIRGEVQSYDNIILKTMKGKLLLSKNIDFLMSFELSRRGPIKIDIALNNASVADAKVLWPVFLDNFGIRDWVIEHLRKGYIPKAIANMNFIRENGSFSLVDVKSEIFFKDAQLDYHGDFPAISHLNAKAVFTKNDMNIYVDSANIVETSLKNGKIYMNFDDRQHLLNISAKTSGRAYEAMYFIDNGAREKIKKIVTTYANGLAFLDVEVKIPISDGVYLSDTFIKINGEVRDNNTFLLAKQSNFKINILKKFKSNVFSSEFNLANSNINFGTIDFVKLNGQNLKVSLDIDTTDVKKILLNSIAADGDVVSFSGRGIIKHAILSELQIYNVSYSNNSFDVYYSVREDSRGEVRIIGRHLNFNKKVQRDDLENYVSRIPENPDSILNNSIYSMHFEDFLVNGEYTLKNIGVDSSFTAGTIDYLNAQIHRNDDHFMSLNITKTGEQENNDKYIFRVECSNFGKFLSELNITDNLVYGDLYLNGSISANNNVIGGNVRLKNNFSYITETTKNKNAKFFNYILNSNELPKNIKSVLVNQNTMSFARLQADFKLTGNDLVIDNFLLNSDEVLGIGVSGSGSMDISSGKIHFAGLVIPLEKISMLFGINKIPLVNKLLFGKEDSGLLVLGYKFTKNTFDSDYSFEILPSSVINPVSLAHLLIIFLLL